MSTRGLVDVARRWTTTFGVRRQHSVAGTTNLFFATDIHGSNSCFKQFLNVPKYLKERQSIEVHALVLGGDVTGKIPIIIEMTSKTGATAYRSDKAKTKIAELDSADEIRQFEQLAADAGSYTYRCTREQHDELRYDVEHRDGALWNAVVSSLKVTRMQEWVALADERMHGKNIRIFFNAGNDDDFEIDKVIDSSTTMIRPEGTCVAIDDHVTMISTGFANVTPFHCPRDVSEDQLARKIDEMASQVPDLNKCIFNLHCPPFNTNLDKGPALDRELRPGMTGFGKEQAHVGSIAVRNAIERYQPVLGLHGHIHESDGAHRIGRTLCLNPGSNYETGALAGVRVSLQRGIVRSHQFHK